MKTHTIEITEQTIEFLLQDIHERCQFGGELYRKGDIDKAATKVRLLSDSANTLACLLTKIAGL